MKAVRWFSVWWTFGLNALCAVLWLTALVLTGSASWIPALTISAISSAALFPICLSTWERVRDEPMGSWRCVFGHKWMAFQAYRMEERFVIAAGRFVMREVRCYRCGRGRWTA